MATAQSKTSGWVAAGALGLAVGWIIWESFRYPLRTSKIDVSLKEERPRSGGADSVTDLGPYHVEVTRS